MPKRLDATTCHARAEALEECIPHLDQPWTAHESTNGPGVAGREVVAEATAGGGTEVP